MEKSENIADSGKPEAIGAGVVAGGQQPLPLHENTPPHQSTFLERNSLRIAGIANLVGDLGFVANGWQTKNPYKISGGLLYTLGGANLTWYGKVDKERTFRDVSERTAQFIEEHGGRLPDNCELLGTLHRDKTSGLGNIDQMLRRKPAKNTLTLYTAGAAALLGSGIHEYRHNEGAEGLYYGVTSLGIKLASLMIPEDMKHQPQPQDKQQGFAAWIKEKPLRLYGYGSLITDGILTWKAMREYRRNPAKSDYAWTTISSGAYILADAMMAVSHKDPSNADGHFTAEETARMVALTADAISREPKERQDELVKNVAAFLTEQPEIGGDKQAIEEAMRQHMNPPEHEKPWAQRTQQEPPPSQHRVI